MITIYFFVGSFYTSNTLDRTMSGKVNISHDEAVTFASIFAQLYSVNTSIRDPLASPINNCCLHLPKATPFCLNSQLKFYYNPIMSVLKTQYVIEILLSFLN